MALRYIATRTEPQWGLNEEEEFVSQDENLKSVLYNFGWLKPYDDTMPLPPKGMVDYEPGKSYRPNRYVIYDQHIYKSKVQTSDTWVALEWDLKV